MRPVFSPCLVAGLTLLLGGCGDDSASPSNGTDAGAQGGDSGWSLPGNDAGEPSDSGDANQLPDGADAAPTPPPDAGDASTPPPDEDASVPPDKDGGTPGQDSGPVQVVCGDLPAPQDKNGTISADETWEGYIRITGDLQLSGGANVTVLGCTTIEFDGDYELQVKTGSVLTLDGLASEPILVDASKAGGELTVRGGQGVVRHSRLNGVKLVATYPQAAPPLLVFEDSVHVNGSFSTFEQAVVIARSLIAGSGSHTMVGSPPGSMVTDNVIVGGTWVTKGLGGTVRGNVFVSDLIPPGGATDDYTHEHIVGILAGAVIERNIFVGGSYAAIMAIGADNGDGAIIRNNTIDKRDRGAGFMFHLTEPKPQGLVFRNNIFMRGKGIEDEEETPNALAYTDYNFFVDVSDKYPGVVMSGKSPGDDGFGMHSVEASGAASMFESPDVGYPFPYGAAELLNGQKTVFDALNLYRNAYAPKVGSPAIDSGSPADANDPEVQDGQCDIGAVERN